LSTNPELERVLSNPANVLMSDSLEGVIDPHLLEDPNVWGAGAFICQLEFADFEISGTLQSFSAEPDQKTISVLVVPSNAIKLLTGNFLQRYRCLDTGRNIIFEETISDEIFLNVTFVENDRALVSIMIKHVNT